MELTVDNLTEATQKFFKETFEVSVSKDRVRGVVFTALKDAGKLTKEDRYKTYEHISKMMKIFNDAFGEEIIGWEEMEQFTGNLFYGMRVATSRPLQEIQRLMEKAEKGESVSYADLRTLQESTKQNMTDTWKYLETTQLTGAGMIVAKILQTALFKSLLKKQNKKEK